MAKIVPLYRASTGLNVTVDPERITYDPKVGLVDLQACWNVELDRTGRISRRRGFTLIEEGAFHSLYSVGEYAFAVKDDSLVWITAEGVGGTITTLTQYGNRISYATVGGRTYYSNGADKGYIEGKINHAWEAGTYVGKSSIKTISGPPPGQLLEIAFGRMWIAYDSYIYYSEPFAYNYYDYARAIIPFSGRVTLVKAVLDGLYVSDPTGVYFLNGTDPNAMQSLRITDSPAIEGAVAQELINGMEYGARTNYLYCLFVTKKGICIAGPGGDYLDLTYNKIKYPNVNRGSVVVREDNSLILLQK